MNLHFKKLARMWPGDVSQILDKREQQTERRQDHLEPATYAARMRRFDQLRDDLLGRSCLRRMMRRIAKDLEYSANWRDQKGEEYRDQRNRDAANLLRRFAAELRGMRPTSLSCGVQETLANWSYHASDTEAELIRDVGFREHPVNGVDFLERLASRVGVA